MSSEITRTNTPTHLFIGPYKYTVVYDAEAAFEYGFSGSTLFRSKRILLDPMQSDTEIPQTLLHEALHGLGSAYEIKEWVKHNVDDDGKSIDKIDLMASALIQWMRQNRETIEWLMDS